MQFPIVGEKYHVNHDDNTLQKMVYGPTYVPYNEDGQKLLLPQTTDMSRKDNSPFPEKCDHHEIVTLIFLL